MSFCSVPPARRPYSNIVNSSQSDRLWEIVCVLTKKKKSSCARSVRLDSSVNSILRRTGSPTAQRGLSSVQSAERTRQSHASPQRREKLLLRRVRKCFLVKSALVIHRQIHTDERPYSCTGCSDTFRQSAGLASHMLRHTGAKPFDCDECGRTFSQRNSLKVH